MIHRFPCGTLALDFVGTLRARRNVEPTEKLTQPTDLDAWFSESGMLDAVTAATASDLAEAIELREAIYALAYARVTGDELPTDAVATVSSHAERLPISVSLTDGKLERTGSVRQALSSLARETIEIVGGPDAGLLRECSRPECTQVYLDTSRGHRRDWCSMKTCGNRVKASKFRARHSTRAATA
jgi:predicted RNA-binding Zn ribbon-like protein